MINRARVAILRTSPATVVQDYAQLFELAGLHVGLDRSTPTTLVLDQRRHFPFPAANTPPWQLEGVARALYDAGYRDRMCVQPRSTIVGAFKGQDLNGYAPLLRACGVADWHAGSSRQPGLVLFYPQHPLPALERVCEGEFHISTWLLAANVVSLPTFKTDRATTVGGAVCCLAGALLPGWPRAGRSLFHETPVRHQPSVVAGHKRWATNTGPQTHELLVDLLSLQREVCAGQAAVMDGTTAGDGSGPYALRPQVRSIILASADPLALDAAAARIMGFDPLRDVAYLRLAHERGLGVADPHAIELVGDADLAQQHWNFRAGGHLQLDVLGMLDRLVVGTPLAGPLALAAEIYRDFYRWPLKDRQVFESWLRHTSWG